MATHLTRAAAHWAARQGASHLTLVTTRANVAANALYTGLGFKLVGHYQYRIHPEDSA
jgi:ribosomal protein S18 acetylase RimI-like enzyme